MAIYGDDYNRFVSREILTNLSNNDGVGLPVMGAGLGMGINVGNLIAGMANQIVRTQQSSNNQQPIICSKSS